MSYRHTINFELQKKTTRDGVEICLPQLHCRAKYLPAMGWPTKKQGVGAMTFANRSWYLGWLNLSTRIRNSIKKRRGKKLMVVDHSSFVQIKQKGHKRKKKEEAKTIHTLLQSRPRKSRLLVRNASQQQQPQPIGLKFLRRRIFVFIIKGSYYQLSGRYSSFVTFFFSCLIRSIMTQKNLLVFFFFLSRSSFFMHLILYLYLIYIYAYLFFFL